MDLWICAVAPNVSCDIGPEHLQVPGSANSVANQTSNGGATSRQTRPDVYQCQMVNTPSSKQPFVIKSGAEEMAVPLGSGEGNPPSTELPEDGQEEAEYEKFAAKVALHRASEHYL